MFICFTSIRRRQIKRDVGSIIKAVSDEVYSSDGDAKIKPLIPSFVKFNSLSPPHRLQIGTAIDEINYSMRCTIAGRTTRKKDERPNKCFDCSKLISLIVNSLPGLLHHNDLPAPMAKPRAIFHSELSRTCVAVAGGCNMIKNASRWSVSSEKDAANSSPSFIALLFFFYYFLIKTCK